MSKKTKVILDCDPGYDDAIAISMIGKSDKFEILGITSVAGNNTIENTTRNALDIVNYLNLNIPVYKGQDCALIAKSEIAGCVHGKNGLGGVDLEGKEDKIKLSEGRAVDFIIKKCLENPKDITIIATGPLTNIALAIKLEPKIIDCINEIVSMGGSLDKGNVTPYAEFNYYDDPEAAYIVYHSGIKVKMFGLNCTSNIIINEEIIKRIGKINNKASKLFVQSMTNYCTNLINTYGPKVGIFLHDPCTVASMIKDDLSKYKKMNIEVVINHDEKYGQTISEKQSKDNEIYKHEVAMEINREEFWNIVENELKKY